MPIPNINVSLYPGLRANNSVAPRVSTRSGMVDGARGGDVPAQVIFSDNFDGQPDWTGSQDIVATGVTGWSSSRNGGDAGGPHYGDAAEISGSDVNKVRGGTGKAFVGWRESYSLLGGGAGWNSDGILEVDLDRDYDELFIRFYIKFQPGWTKAGQSKFFRVRHLDPGGQRYSFFSNGDSCPIFIWDYGHNEFGVRNILAMRADPQETNYFFSEAGIPNLPRQLQSGDVTLNFRENITDLDGDSVNENPVTIIDKTTGSVLDLATSPTVVHDQIYGDTWNKVEFHLKINSAPGVQDGVLTQWINDQLTFRNVTMPWLGTNSPGGIGWNVISIGGNDNFNAYPNADQVREWYSIDDLVVYDGLPEDMQ